MILCNRTAIERAMLNAGPGGPMDDEQRKAMFARMGHGGGGTATKPAATTPRATTGGGSTGGVGAGPGGDFVTSDPRIAAMLYPPPAVAAGQSAVWDTTSQDWIIVDTPTGGPAGGAVATRSATMPTITKDGAYFVGGKEVTKSVYDAELAKRKSTGFAAPKPGQPGEYGTTGASQGNKPVLTEQGGRYYIDGQEVAKVTWDKARSNAAASGDAGMFRKIVSGQSIPTGPMLGGQDGRGIEADPRGTAPASGTQHAGGTAGFDEKTGQYIDPQTGKLLPKGVKPTDSQRKFTAVTDAQGNVTIPGTDIVIPPAVVKSMAEKGISLQPPTKTAATTTTQKATDLSKGRSAAPVAARPAQPSTNSKWDGALQKWIVESSGKKGADMVWNADKQKWTPQSKAITKKQRTAASKSKPLKVGSPEWAASVRSGSL